MADEKKIATREENLNKINEELEKLSDEELEQVAGGMIDLWCVQNKNPNTDTIIGKERIISFGK